MEPTNRELKIMFDLSERRSDEKHAEMMEALGDIKKTSVNTLAQATKTNGRVNRHSWYFVVLWWALGALWVLLLIGVPLAYKLLMYSIRNDFRSEVDLSVKEYLQNNVESIQYAE